MELYALVQHINTISNKLRRFDERSIIVVLKFITIHLLECI